MTRRRRIATPGELSLELDMWQSAWLMSRESRLRLMRLRLGLEQDLPLDGTPPDLPMLGEFFPLVDQLRLWTQAVDLASLGASGEGVQAAERHYVAVLSRLDEEGSRAWTLERLASRLIVRVLAANLAYSPVPPTREALTDMVEAPAFGATAWGLARALSAAIDAHPWTQPTLGQCVYCGSVRPVAELHEYRSPTAPRTWSCAVSSPPADRLGLGLADHWGAPCSCSCCRDVIAVVIGPATPGELPDRLQANGWTDGWTEE
jgi:hypothetical protein